jgi:cell division protein FtsB
MYAMVSVPLRILSEEGLPRYRRLQAQLTQMRGANVTKADSIERLNREVESLRNDPAAIERIARDELGLVKPGEVIFQFSEPR